MEKLSEDKKSLSETVSYKTIPSFWSNESCRMEQQQFSLSISHYTINSVLTWLMMIYPPPTPGLSSAALRRKSDCAHFFYLLFVCYSMEYLIIWRWRFPKTVTSVCRPKMKRDAWVICCLFIVKRQDFTQLYLKKINITRYISYK